LKTLLEDGFTVRAAVRSQSKADYLKSRFAEHEDKLEFVIIDDITTPGVFDDAVKDVDAVLHTASPLSGPDPLGDADNYIKPAVDGTLGVLKSALNSPTVQRIVVTASVAACSDLQPKYTPITYNEVCMGSSMTTKGLIGTLD
jgi:nucleoside-diphosphate-sugar epimerase